MKSIWIKVSALIFLAFYLAPTLELDAKECKTNYSNECHQYVNCQTEQSSFVAKTIKQSVQEFNLIVLSDLNLEKTVSAFVLLPDDPLPPKRIFSWNSILII